MLLGRYGTAYRALVAFEEGLTGDKVVGYTSEVKEYLPRILSEKHTSGPLQATVAGLGANGGMIRVM
jgi:hypothetical protein